MVALKNKFLFCIWIVLTNSIILNAKSKDKDIVLTVFGDGNTQKEAIDSALRSAIEQTFGAFISSSSEVLNDELVNDEIRTISSGYVKKYQCLSENKLPNGNVSVTLKAILSAQKVFQYCSSKGSSVDFDGESFAIDLKMRNLNKNNEKIALTHLRQGLKELSARAFDFQLKTSQPILKKEFRRETNQRYEYECYQIKCLVSVYSNNNTSLFYEQLFSTLSSLAMTLSEIGEYNQLKIPYYQLRIGYEDIVPSRIPNTAPTRTTIQVFNISLRDKKSVEYLEDILSNFQIASQSFTIKDNNENQPRFIAQKTPSSISLSTFRTIVPTRMYQTDSNQNNDNVFDYFVNVPFLQLRPSIKKKSVLCKEISRIMEFSEEELGKITKFSINPIITIYSND